MTRMSILSICFLLVPATHGVAQTAQFPIEAPTLSAPSAPQPNGLLHTPQMSASPSFIDRAKPAPHVLFQIPAAPHAAPTLRSMAKAEGPCYALRSYGFTTEDLALRTPTPSTATSCTPARNTSRKSIRVEPAR